MRKLDVDQSLLPALTVLDHQNYMNFSLTCFTHNLTVLRIGVGLYPIDFSLVSTLVRLFVFPYTPGNTALRHPPDFSPLLRLIPE